MRTFLANLPAILTSLVAVVVAVISARRQTRADDKANSVAERTVSLAEWTKYKDALTERINELQHDNEKLTVRVETLEAETMSLTNWKRLATEYIHQLHARLRDSDMEIPDPPRGLDL